MKKSTGVIGVIVVLGAAWLGTTWYVGKEAQKTIEEVVAQANQRIVTLLGPDLARSDLKIEINDYQRRFFSSEVVYTIHMKDGDDQPLDLTLRDHLQHGPFPLGALQSGEFAPMLAHSKATLVPTPATQAWVDSQKGASPLLVETRVGFGGSGRSVWTFAPTELIEDGEKLTFSGGAITIDFSNDFNDSSTVGQFESFALADEQTSEKTLIKGIKLKSNSSSENGKNTRVRSSATVDALNMEGEGGPVAVENIAATLDSLHTGNILDASLRYDFGRIVLGATDMGSVSLGGKVNQLDTEALTALVADYDAIKAKHGVKNDEDLVMTEEEEAAMRKRLDTLLASAPSVAIEPLVWKNSNGESKASLHVSLSSPAEPGPQSLDTLISQVLKQVKLDFTLARPMFIQAFSQAQSDPEQKEQMEMMGAMIFDQYMARLQQAGLVKLDGEAAGTAILYEKSRVTVNGKEMPVSEFMQRVVSVLM